MLACTRDDVRARAAGGGEREREQGLSTKAGRLWEREGGAVAVAVARRERRAEEGAQACERKGMRGDKQKERKKLERNRL